MSHILSEMSELKTKRSAAKGAVTRIITKGNSLMSDDSNAEEVQSLVSQVEEALDKFNSAHGDYHQTLEHELDIEESETYLESVNQKVEQFKADVDQWLSDIKDQPQEETEEEPFVDKEQEILKKEEEMAEFRRQIEQRRQEMESEHKHYLAAMQEEMEGLKRLQRQKLDEFDAKMKMHSTPQRSEKSEDKSPFTRLSMGNQGDISTLIMADTLRDIFEESKAQQQYLVETLHAPKINLISFDGNPLKYWPFIKAFDNAVKVKDDSIKLNALVQHCTGEVRDLLQCCLVKEPGEGYALARDLLKSRYGQEEVIAQAWMNKIMDRPKVKDLKQLRSFADDLRCCRETLLTMNQLQELENRTTLKAIAAKLSESDYNRWLRVNFAIKEDKKRAANVKDIVDFVDRLARERADPVFGYADKMESKKEQRDPKKEQREKKQKPRVYSTDLKQTEKASSASKPSAGTCPKCKEGAHYLNQCPVFRKMAVKDRLSFVQSSGRCVNCFRPGHKGSDCAKPWVCNVDGCGQKHNRWLHLPKPTPAPERTEANDKTEGEQEVVFAATVVSQSKIALPIKPVLVKAKDGRYIKAYALHDNCSSGSLCSEGLVQRLGLPTQPLTATLTTVSQKTEVKTAAVDLELTDLSGEFTYSMKQVLTRPTLNIDIGCLVTNRDLARWDHLSDLDLPDVDLNKVELLIGQDNPDLLVPLETRQGDTGGPYAVRTCMGWGVSGPVIPTGSSSFTSYFMDLNSQVEKFWRLDDPFVQTEAYSISDKKAVSVWENSIHLEQHKGEDHYSMKIPFKQSPPTMPDNYIMAKHRLDLLGKKLARDPELKEKYTKCVRDNIDKGYAEKVPDEELNREDGAVWYLPHHAVRKSEKTRVVFDCAAQYQGVSLNQMVRKGPDLTNKLVGVLVRFRQEPIAFTADIQGMFNQVRVDKEDRDMLRFLWWKDDDPSKGAETYRMATHLFGGVWSPSCCAYALKKTGEDAQDVDEETIKTLDRNFYVDDCLKSVLDTHVAVRLVQQLRQLLAGKGFRLMKFMSNSREVLRALPETEVAGGSNYLDLENGLPEERALGVLWNVEGDSFTFKFSVPQTPSTKRGVLSALSAIYDPLGFVSPYVLQAKRIFQTLCRLKRDWDESIPSDLEEQWTRWKEDLPTLAQIEIQRCLRAKHLVQPVSAQLHLFSDASEVGLGASAYLRTVDVKGQVGCTLVMSKSRLAPLKTTTIPRLELTAAVVAVKLEKSLREHLEIPLLESVFWTDSMIVLQYLRNEEKRFQTFVANRVAEIREASDPQQWKHVDSSSNPADDISRGMTAEELVSSRRWVAGPAFLMESEEHWPEQPSNEETLLDSKAEVKRDPQIYHVTCPGPGLTPTEQLLRHFSQWNSLKRATAWILRLKDHLRKSPKAETGRLTVWEMERAEKSILTHVQRSALSKEQLQSVKKLAPVDDEGVLRVGGRLANAPLSYSACHPAILPSQHPVTELIIRHYHVLYGHSGTERILQEVRQKFWPIGGRSAVRRVLRQCIPCKKKRARPETQYMANLPSDRVTPGDPPFTKVGVDYFGPMIVKRGRTEYKRYGCLFTCLVTRAVHIEIAHSLDTDSFVHALQRFIARRGEPNEIRSDNGTNFVGAKKELAAAIKEWNQDQIHSYLLQKNITWIFNPPGASHMGGVWERMIRTVRSLMVSLGQEQKMTDECLCTLMCNIESIINGRPLTKLSEDPTDPRPLTPNHLLLLRAGPTLPPGKFVVQDLYRRRWKQVQYLADLFWKRWLKEYLPLLQERHKWLEQRPNLQPGDLVLVVSDDTARNCWPLGLVVETYPSGDGLVRSVRVKTQTGLYVRPVTKICLLEASHV